MYAPQRSISLARDLTRVALATGALLLVPLAAMAFTREVSWSGVDFAIAAVLIGSAGMAMLRAARLRASSVRRVLAGSAVALAFAALWVELAVGVFFQLGS